MFRRTNTRWVTSASRRLLAGAVATVCFLTGCSTFSGREPVRIQVKMKKYTFDPPVIRVQQGDLVELEVSTADVQHPVRARARRYAGNADRGVKETGCLRRFRELSRRR